MEYHHSFGEVQSELEIVSPATGKKIIIHRWYIDGAGYAKMWNDGKLIVESECASGIGSEGDMELLPNNSIFLSCDPNTDVLIIYDEE